MKTKATFALAAMIVAIIASLVIADSDPKDQALMEKPVITKTDRMKKKNRVAASTESKKEPALVETEVIAQSVNELEANLDGWKRRFEALVTENGDRDAAIAALRGEIDTVFSDWVAGEIAPLAELPPLERYDKLDVIGQSVTEGAATVLEMLGIPGSRHVSLAAEALDRVAAETEYAEAAPDHTSRLALLHIDRERQGRLHELVAIEDEAARAKAMSELEAWYGSSLARVFPENASDDGMN